MPLALHSSREGCISLTPGASRGLFTPHLPSLNLIGRVIVILAGRLWM